MNRPLFQLLFLAIVITGGFSACIVVENPYTGLPPGPWRGILELDPQPVTYNPEGEPLPELMSMDFEEVSQGILPFNFEVVYEAENDFHIEIINGQERIRLDDITIGRDRSTAKDTVIINFPAYDSYIRAIYEEDVMEGEWVVSSKDNYRIPFKAYQGQGHRFTTLRKEPVMDISGRWEATFEIEKETPYKAVGEFRQDGNHLTGTFLTETGDYRYLEGSVQANKAYLSTFDGAHAFLFEAKIQEEDSTLIGSFRSGKHYKTLWRAVPGPDFRLRDAEELTYLKEGYERISFSFENPAGKEVSLSDPAYTGKPVLVQLMGTWCPNCHDETQFIKAYREAHPDQEFAIIALAFERYRNEEKAKRAIETFKKEMGVDHEVLHAGYADKEAAADALPMLNHVMAFPTLIFIGRRGKVQRIHTGFSGPATNEYEAFKKDFEKYMNQLLSVEQ